jgi:hypothetical protein
MNAKLNLKSLKLPSFVTKYLSRFSTHMMFAVIIVILMSYVFVVLKISGLTKAEPDPTAGKDTSTLIPRVNQKAVDHIESLESNNTQIHSLFEKARDNPFQE